MNRRNFLIGTAVTGVVASTGVHFMLAQQTPRSELTIATTIAKLDELMVNNPSSIGPWSLAKIFNHCAQSVEFSMSEFPEHKPVAFKNTVGKLAFEVFNSRGEMRHNLSEGIPSAPKLSEDADLTKAYVRLRNAMLDFSQFEGELAEHFAFGQLTKEQYETAHAMHFNNHLLQINTQSS